MENDKHDYLPTEDGARCPASPPHCCELARVCNTEQHNLSHTHTKYRIYILVTLSSIQGFGVSGCISCIVMYHYATQVHQFYCVLALSPVSLWGSSIDCIVLFCLYCEYCILVRQVHRLYRPHKDCHLYTESLHLSVWNLKAPFVIHFNVFSNRYQMLKITLISLTNLSSSFS